MARAHENVHDELFNALDELHGICRKLLQIVQMHQLALNQHQEWIEMQAGKRAREN